ncbi:pseudouridine synthase, partial [Jeotgalibacillus marinus]
TFSLEQLRQAAGKFLGTIQQVPPPFSAKKIAGVPAYKMARKNQPVELKPKQVEVKEFEILDFDGERAHFTAWVSSGTYLRS